MNRSKRIVMMATFAAITAVLDSFPGIPQFESGIWYSWIFLIIPILGLIFNPLDGFLTALIGVLIGHYLYFRGPYEFLFTLGVPIGTALSSLLYRKKNRIPMLFYSACLTAYFLTPIAHQIPYWGIWNIYVAFILLVTVIPLQFEKGRYLIVAFLGLEADILFRIFLFVPLGTYRIFYGFNLDTMKLIWTAGAVITPIQVALSLFILFFTYPYIQKIIARFRIDYDP